MDDEIVRWKNHMNSFFERTELLLQWQITGGKYKYQ
jgi:hypothetical protein